MRTKNLWNRVSYLMISVMIVSSLMGCSVVALKDNKLKSSERQSVRTETRPTNRLAEVKAEISLASQSDRLTINLQKRNYYYKESRRKVTGKGAGDLTFVTGLIEFGVWLALLYTGPKKIDDNGIETSEPDWDRFAGWRKGLLIGMGVDMFLGWLLWWGFVYDEEITNTTPWQLHNELTAGLTVPISFQRISVSLPQLQWQKSYSTNAAGVVKVPLSELTSAVSSIPDPADVLNMNSIAVNVSTEIDGKTLNKSTTLSSMSALQAFRDAARQEQRHRQEAPADLSTEVVFSDETDFIPNQALDAGEQSGNLKVTVRNKGRGLGFGVTLQLQSNNTDVKLDTTKSLGDIPFNEEKTVTFPIETSLQAKDGFVNILVETKEKRGFDAQKQQIRIPVVHLAEPKLEITSLSLNDKQLGNAVGNGNGIPENNETIEIAAFIKNSGVGNAIGTKLDLVSINPGIEILERSSDLGTIRPNQTVKGTLLFRVPRTYKVEAGSTLDYKVRVEDIRGADTAEQNKTLGLSSLRIETIAMSAQQPILAYSIQAPATLHNGRTAQFQIIPKNTGTLAAKGVNLQLSTQSATVTPRSVSLGGLSANTSGLPQPFTVTLPRTYKEQNLTLDIKMTQADFVGLTKTETYPVELIAPDLILTDRFFDSSGDGKIEQGERVELEVRVTNKGKLESLNTMLQVSTSKSMVRIKPKSKSIGTLPENTTSDPMKFTLTVPRGVEAGALPIMLEVTQTDFPAVTKTLEYTIYEVGAATTVVEAKKPEETLQPEAFRGNQPPTILPGNIKDNQTIYTRDYQLQVSVSDDSGLTSAQVRLNGRVIYNSQTDPSAADKLRDSGGMLLSFIQPLTTLKEGDNELVFSAIDNNNERAEITFHLNYNPKAQVIAGLDNPSDVDVEIPKGKARNQNAVALVIGIEKYQNVSPALYADRDALAFKQYLIDLIGLNDANIIHRINERATTGGIKTALSQLKNLVTPGQSDVFVLYSGHGAPTLDGKDKFLIPYDCDPNYLQDGGYPLMGFYKRLSELNAKSVIVFMDACFSGMDKDNNLIFEDAKPLFRTVEGAAAYQNLEIFSSSTGAQISSSFKEQRHGMFTYYLLKGMRGEADSDKDGTITLAEMEAYVKEQVSTQARRMNREQEPMLTGQKERALVRYE